VDWKGLGLHDYPKLIKHPMDLGTIRNRLKSNAKQQHYKTIFQVAEDVRTVWTNCLTYNQDGSDFHKLATTLQKKWDERYTKLLSELSSTSMNQEAAAMASATTAAAATAALSTSTSTTTTSASQQKLSAMSKSTSVSSVNPSSSATALGSSHPYVVTITERRNFAKSLYHLSKEDLGKLLSEVDLKCPAALTKNSAEDEVEFNVDVIPSPLLKELADFALKHASTTVGNAMPNAGGSGGTSNSLSQASESSTGRGNVGGSMQGTGTKKKKSVSNTGDAAKKAKS
jgi:hypothetical protein